MQLPQHGKLMQRQASTKGGCVCVCFSMQHHGLGMELASNGR